ncbi:hypothetical protein M5689_024947 [Euphorbia peplus]|nr:hypothetical protein M5689_024947 [Euphorbia peplus]
MHEFSILDSDDLVLCRIRNSDHEKKSVDHNNLRNKASNPTKKTTRANPIKVANKNRLRKMTRDSLIMNANVVNVLPQDGYDHIHKNPTSIDGNMTQFKFIQDNNLSFTEIEPPLMDVVANNEGKLDDHAEYNQQIINANPGFFQPQGHRDNHIHSYPTSSYGHMTQFESIQDNNISFTEIEPPLMDVVANDEGKLYDLVEYNEHETLYVLKEYQNFTDMIGLAANHNYPMKRTRDSVIINANPVFYPQGDNTFNHILSNSASVNGINMIDFEPIQDTNFYPSYDNGQNLNSMVQECHNLSSNEISPVVVVEHGGEQVVTLIEKT